MSESVPPFVQISTAVLPALDDQDCPELIIFGVDRSGKVWGLKVDWSEYTNWTEWAPLPESQTETLSLEA